jgi:hypothetical protein
MTTADDNWEDYESNFLFPPLDGPQCTCAHDATSHGYSNCEITGCNCPAYWEHT